MIEVKILALGENSKGYWALVQYVNKGFFCEAFVKPVSLDGLSQGDTISVPKDALESK
jgi:hypothetical protein